MKYPRLPDWAVYAVAAAALLVVSLSRRENADAPLPPEGGALIEEALLGPVARFDASDATAADPGRAMSGTAFSISADGRWVTARHVVQDCRRPAVSVGGGQAVAADVRLAPHADVALLLTEGGAEALPLAAGEQPARGALGYHPGYPRGRPGEAASRLLGAHRFRHGRRGQADEPVLAWAEIGRTQALEGSLAGLSGAPVLDAEGRALGVTIAASPRRGRIYTTAPKGFASAVRGVQGHGEWARPEAMTLADYGRVADDLRRDLRVAQVVCLA